MELLPTMKLSWLSGWILLGSFYLVFFVLMVIFPRPVVRKLCSVSGWSREQRVLSAAGKPFALASLALIIFTPLKIGEPVFVVGTAIFVIGFVVMVVALFNYRDTPVDQPVEKGLYRVSRNPQWLALVAMFLGSAIAVGSWTAVMLLAACAIFYHFRILGEERACRQQFGAPYEAYLDRVPRYLAFV